MTPQPITYRCVAGTLIPKQRWLFDRTFADGQEYELAIHEPRSTKSHDHYFAAVREGWKNLPEKIAKRYPDAEHLRKWSLIKCGYVKERTVVCDTEEAAVQVAALAGSMDESAVVSVFGTVVTVAVAKSQKTTGPDAMDKDEFQRSKTDVLEYIAGLIGVDVATLSSQVSNPSDANLPPEQRTDTPAASETRPPTDVAGVTTLEASLLSPDWMDVYINTMANPTTRAMSIMTRDTTALQMIGAEPNAAEREWMRQVATLTNRRDKGKLKRGEFESEISKLRTIELTSRAAA